MAGISGTNNYNFYSGNNLANLTSSLFGSTSSMLGDYAMIKSGTYKKLLTAYYGKPGTSSTSSNESTKSTYTYNWKDKLGIKDETDTKTSELTNKYLEIKDGAGSLQSSISKLSDYALYSEKTAEDGTTSYDREGIKKAVQSFISDYNSLISSSSKVSSSSMSSQISGLEKLTKDYENKLAEVGITIGKDGKLVLDEEKLGSADVKAISNLFKGNASYGSLLSSRAAEIAKLANSSAYSSTRASSYSQSGSYSVMGNSNTILDQLF